MPEKIVNKDKYTYNAELDSYVIPMKHRVKPYVIRGYKVRAIRRAVANLLSPSLTAFDIKTKFGILEDDFDALKKAFDLSRDAFPLTDEELNEETPEESLHKLLEEKRTSLIQNFEKEEWREAQKDASCWRDFVSKQLDPFSSALDNWAPPIIPALPKPLLKRGEISDEVLVIGLSDLHFGASGNSRYMFNRPDWSTEKTVECVNKYAQEIVKNAQNRKSQFKKVVVLGLGDLIHSVNGKTGRGTELIYDTVREEQFDYALNSLYAFIGMISQLAPVTEVHDVGGNHNYEAEMALWRALEQAYRDKSNIKFSHYATRPAAFKEGSTLFLLDHGADSIERAYVPTTESKLQTHIQSLLLQIPEMLIGTKERLFCQGDKHHWEHIEYNDFQFIMFGTSMGGDQHSAVHNLKNRPRQSCLILNNNGLKAVEHVYFD